MPNLCCISDCGGTKHTFAMPKREPTRAAWQRALFGHGVPAGRETYHVCYKHFRRADMNADAYEKADSQRLRLMKDAVPSVFADTVTNDGLNLTMSRYHRMELQPSDCDPGQPRSSPQPSACNGVHSGVPLTVMEMTDFTVLLPVPRDNGNRALDEIPESRRAKRADSPKLALLPPQRDDGPIKDLGSEEAQNKQPQTIGLAPIVCHGDSKNAHSISRTGLKRDANHLDEADEEIREKQHKTIYSYDQYFPRMPLAKGDSDGIANALHQAQRAVYCINGLMEFITSEELGKVNRLEFWSRLTFYVTVTMEDVIAFAKCVPGFTTLSQDDQIMVIKGAGFSLVVMHLLWCCTASGYKLPNHEEPVLDSLHNLDKEEKDLVAVVLDLLRHMLALKLTEREIAVLNAVVMFQPERCRVQDSTQLKELYGKQLEAFTELGNRSHESTNFADKAMLYLPYIQAVSLKHFKALTYFKTVPSTIFHFPALYTEIFDVT